MIITIQHEGDRYEIESPIEKLDDVIEYMMLPLLTAIYGEWDRIKEIKELMQYTPKQGG